MKAHWGTWGGTGGEGVEAGTEGGGEGTVQRTLETRTVLLLP